MSRLGRPAPSGGGGDIIPRVQYDGRSGRMFRVDRTEDGGGWSDSKVDITRTFKAVVDLQNIESGWMDFATGGAPAFVLGTAPNIPPKPQGGKFAFGSRIMLKLAKACAGDVVSPVREMCSSAGVYLDGLELLVSDYDAAAAANPGKLPVVELKDSVPVTSKPNKEGQSSTNYRPVFAIVGWVDRPADFVFVPRAGEAAPAPAAAPSEAAPRQAPPETGSTVVAPPPAAAPAPAPAPADEDDFG